jgi:hypothetical protein
MATAYTPPGVTVTENTSTSVSALIASATDICIVGLAGNPNTSQTPLTTTDVLILSGTNPVVLPTLVQIHNDAVLVAFFRSMM